jgi:peptidoglycan L-alanyl-D-glutamate endopeptidase CwlK
MAQDAVTLQRINKLHPKLRAEALQIYNEIVAALSGRATVRFSYTLRTFAEQQALFNQGRTTAGKIVTNARAGQSYHNYGLAVDIVLLVDKDVNGTFETASWDTSSDFDADRVSDWMECVRIFKKYGWTWGADWDNDGLTKAMGDKDEKLVDAPHFQKTFGWSVSQLLIKHNAKKFDSQGYVLI